MSNGFRLPEPPVGLGQAYGVLSQLLTRHGLPDLRDFEKHNGARQHRLVDEVLRLLNACLDAYADYYYESDAVRTNKHMKAHYRFNERNAREPLKRKYSVGRHAICFESNRDRSEHFRWWASTYYRDVKRDGDGPVTKRRHPLFFETYEIDKWSNGTLEEELPRHDERAATMYLVSTPGTPAQLMVDEDFPSHDVVVQFLPNERVYRVYDPSFVQSSHDSPQGKDYAKHCYDAPIDQRSAENGAEETVFREDWWRWQLR
ncbi:hypothetical protein HDK77DRAFT_506146 [Phyllosticta capitalensis]|uniref:Uncharacterized protein n=1 Tax=Phyllosticta capitalensis TaxID=121624 RepID=A0ABR1YSC8_9PEZI